MLRLLLVASLILPGALQDPPKTGPETEKRFPPFLTYDGNHWTEAGHQYVSQQMLKKFRWVSRWSRIFPESISGRPLLDRSRPPSFNLS
jgi:hypothetical protein